MILNYVFGITWTIAGGAGAAPSATLVDSSGVSGIADDDKIYLEKLLISVISALNGSAAAEGNGIVYIDTNQNGTELIQIGVNQGQDPVMIDVMCELGDAYAAANPTYGDIDAQINAGPSPLADGDKVILTPYYRVI